VHVFDCSFEGATFAFLWIDDHQVCQKGVYEPKPNTFDGSSGNPLRALQRKKVSVRLHIYYNPHFPSAEQSRDRQDGNCTAASFVKDTDCQGDDIGHR
jgi:hypothetical protein